VPDLVCTVLVIGIFGLALVTLRLVNRFTTRR
jgi:hypothetical protein